ncbi:hypothetical protein [uncultured Variovorax sp.]|uniref:hypothetical protein n=1 Tax=uncultured Variovorax sp. TaxID=114708 RepID=UPI0025F8C749|nr:hypothetical protein [uncultured Variovorax sp.]
MPAPPSKDSIAGSGSTPSNAQARAGFDAWWENLYGTSGLLGSTGLPADARTALGIGSVISFRNLVINSNFSINQRGYVSGTNTGAANQYTLDRWRVVTSGQNITFGAAAPDRVVTAPAGGMEQVIEGALVEGGVYTLSWTGTASGAVNGAAVSNGGNTVALAAGTNVTLRFSGGTVDKVRFELGTKATPYERRLPGLELLLCQRYYQVVEAGYTAPVTAGTNYGAVAQFICPMRATPTMATLTDLVATNFGGGTSATPNSANSFFCVKTASVTGNGQYITRFSASAEL